MSERPQLGKPHHHAYVVENIEATVKLLVDQLGAGPFFLIENVPVESAVSRGAPAELIHDSAFGSFGGGAIELMEIKSATPELVEERFSGSRPRIHHVGYVVPAAEVAEMRSSLDERGLTQYLSTRSGEVENSFHDASASLGHDIEIHLDCQPLRDLFGMVSGAAEGWDGSEPLRPVES